MVWSALKKTLFRFTASNGLGLHPALEVVDKFECKTCFVEPLLKNNIPRSSVGINVNKRGMILADGSLVKDIV